MATIAISDLTGFDLLTDNETFLNDLSNDELASAVGGLAPFANKTILTTYIVRPTPGLIKPTGPVSTDF